MKKYKCPSCGEHKPPTSHGGIAFSGVITYVQFNTMQLFCYGCGQSYEVNHHPNNWQSVVNSSHATR